jgi:hypothetical protein
MSLPHILSIDEFKKIYEDVCYQPYNFLYICKDAKYNHLKIRKGFNGILKQFLPPVPINKK